MNDTTITDFTGRDTVTDPLIDFLRKGARELLQVAVKAERDAFLGQFAARRTSYQHQKLLIHMCPISHPD